MEEIIHQKLERYYPTMVVDMLLARDYTTSDEFMFFADNSPNGLRLKLMYALYKHIREILKLNSGFTSFVKFFNKVSQRCIVTNDELSQIMKKIFITVKTVKLEQGQPTTKKKNTNKSPKASNASSNDYDDFFPIKDQLEGEARQILDHLCQTVDPENQELSYSTLEIYNELMRLSRN